MTDILVKQFKDVKGFDYCNQALSYEKELSVQFLRLGEYLFNIREGNLFEPQWSTFSEFCDEFRSLSRESISKLIKVYRTLVVEYQLSEAQIVKAGGWSNIYEALPLMKSRDEAVKWLEDGAIHSRTDIRKLITENKTGVDMSQCSHEDYYVIKICRTCHDKWRLEDSRNE